MRDNLERRIKADKASSTRSSRRCWCRSRRVTEVKSGKKRVVNRKLYPGYLLLLRRPRRLGRQGSPRERGGPEGLVPRSTRRSGFGDFVGGGRNPVPMSPDEIEGILQTMEDSKEKPKLSVDFKKGDRVKIKSGHFENFDGTVDEVNAEKGSVRVIVTIFGRATPVDLEYWELEQV